MGRTKMKVMYQRNKHTKKPTDCLICFSSSQAEPAYCFYEAKELQMRDELLIINQVDQNFWAWRNYLFFSLGTP